MYPWPPRTLSKPTLPIIESVHQRIWTLDKRNVPMLFCPTASLSTKDSIQTNVAHYRLCPPETLSKNNFQIQLCPTIPPSTWNSIQPNSRRFSPCFSVQLHNCPPRTPSKPILPIIDSVHQRL